MAGYTIDLSGVSRGLRFESGPTLVDGQRHVTVQELQDTTSTFAEEVTFLGPVVFSGPMSMASIEAGFVGDVGFSGGVSIGGGLAVGATANLNLVNAQATTCTTLTTDALTLTPGAVVAGLHTHVTVDIPSLVAGGVYGVPSPVAGTITKITVRLKDPVATGDATIVPRIGATIVTSPALVVPLAGTVRGARYTTVPTANNTVAMDSDINFTITGGQTNAVGATAVVTIRRTA